MRYLVFLLLLSQNAFAQLTPQQEEDRRRLIEVMQWQVNQGFITKQQAEDYIRAITPGQPGLFGITIRSPAAAIPRPPRYNCEPQAVFGKIQYICGYR